MRSSSPERYDAAQVDLQRKPKKAGQSLENLLRRCGILRDEGEHGVQGVEQKVRPDARFERRQASCAARRSVVPSCWRSLK